jgi:hypothetical protein
MSELRWKAHERMIAKLLGGQRLPVTGRPSADVVSPRWACEVKLRSRLPLWLVRAIHQSEAAAKETGLAPLLVIVCPQGRGRRTKRLAILPLEILLRLCGGEEETENAKLEGW